MYSLMTNSTVAIFEMPNPFTEALSFEYLQTSGITLLLTKFSAYRDRTQDYLNNNVQHTFLQEIRLVVIPNLSSNNKDSQ